MPNQHQYIENHYDGPTMALVSNCVGEKLAGRQLLGGDSVSHKRPIIRYRKVSKAQDRRLEFTVALKFGSRLGSIIAGGPTKL